MWEPWLEENRNLCVSVCVSACVTDTQHYLLLDLWLFLSLLSNPGLFPQSCLFHTNRWLLVLRRQWCSLTSQVLYQGGLALACVSLNSALYPQIAPVQLHMSCLWVLNKNTFIEALEKTTSQYGEVEQPSNFIVTTSTVYVGVYTAVLNIVFMTSDCTTRAMYETSIPVEGSTI